MLYTCGSLCVPGGWECCNLYSVECPLFHLFALNDTNALCAAVVLQIVTACAPFKVFGSIIRYNFVFVINICTVKVARHKCFTNKSMYETIIFYALAF